METPKPKPRRKRGCAREGCKRRPHELNRNAFALRPPDRSACGAPSPASRSFVLACYLASVGQGPAARVGRACRRAQPDPYLGPRRYPVT